MDGLKELISIINEITRGNYSNDIMELTRPEFPAYVSEIAEAVGMMMVKIEAREFQLEQMNQQLKSNILKTVTSIAHTLAARDKYTEGHGMRVALYAERLALSLGLEPKEVETIKISGILHDIGKISFSDSLFSNKDIKLPTEEMRLEIQRHPAAGFEILKDLDFLENVPEYVYCHHEHLNGEGYPRGLEADDIPLGARIISVVDCFDAITTNRPYQKGKTCEEACAILRKLGGTQLDQHLVDAFIEDIERHGLISL